MYRSWVLFIHGYQGWFQGPPIMGPSYGKFPILFPYHSHIFRDSYGNSMGPAGPIIGGPWKYHWWFLCPRLQPGAVVESFSVFTTSETPGRENEGNNQQTKPTKQQQKPRDERFPVHLARLTWNTRVFFVDFSRIPPSKYFPDRVYVLEVKQLGCLKN